MLLSNYDCSSNKVEHFIAVSLKILIVSFLSVSRRNHLFAWQSVIFKGVTSGLIVIVIVTFINLNNSWQRIGITSFVLGFLPVIHNMYDW